MIAEQIVVQLRKKIRERIDGVRDRTSLGRAIDWAEYREWVGEGKALRTVLDDITEIMRHYEETDDEV